MLKVAVLCPMVTRVTEAVAAALPAFTSRKLIETNRFPSAWGKVEYTEKFWTWRLGLP
jgi:hypothetical protein